MNTLLTADGAVTTVTKDVLQQGDGRRIRGRVIYTVDYTGRLEDGTVFDTTLIQQRKPQNVIIGAGQAIEAWELCIPTMSVGEKCILRTPPTYAYGDLGVPPRIPPNATLTYEIELLCYFTATSFLQSRPLSEKIRAATHAKENGNRLFQQGTERSLKLAIREYNQGLAYFEDIDDEYIQYDVPETNMRKLQAILYLNLAATSAKGEKWSWVKTNCEQALRLDPNNPKAYYRLAQAFAGFKNYEWALKNIKQAKRLLPNDTAIKKLYKEISDIYKQQQERKVGNLKELFSKDNSKPLFSDEEIEAAQELERTRIGEDIAGSVKDLLWRKPVTKVA